jgi:hypothetical protein
VRRQSNLCTHFSFYSAKITKKFGGGRVLWGNWTGLVSVWGPPPRRRVPQKGVSSYQQAPPHRLARILLRHLIGKQGSCQHVWRRLARILLGKQEACQGGRARAGTHLARQARSMPRWRCRRGRRIGTHLARQASTVPRWHRGGRVGEWAGGLARSLLSVTTRRPGSVR